MPRYCIGVGGLPLTMSRNSVLNALTVDVEDYFHVFALSRSIKREDWAALPSRVERNTERLLDLFEAADVQATFFVLGWVAERHAALVRRIHERGHEVACHGYSHRLIYRQTPEAFKQETLQAKRMLEDAAGAAVLGYRAASYSITRQSLWALDVLLEAGFAYDSSIFPVRHDFYGIPGSGRFPYEVEAPSGGRLLEFPPSTYRIAGVNVPAAGGGYFRLYPYAVTRHMLRTLNEREAQPAMFYLHPWEVDPEQPRFKAPWLSRFRHYNNLAKCEPRLRRLLRDFRFSTASSVLTGAGCLEPAASAVT